MVAANLADPVGSVKSSLAMVSMRHRYCRRKPAVLTGNCRQRGLAAPAAAWTAEGILVVGSLAVAWTEAARTLADDALAAEAITRSVSPSPLPPTSAGAGNGWL